MTQEALKLALEFIENSECGTADLEARIKEALAQEQERDYERGFIDGMQKQMQSSVDKAVNRMAQTQEPVAHWSDCAVHNEPAYPKGECDCGGFNPTAWLVEDVDGSHLYWTYKKPIGNEKWTPLFAAPPQRTWVGLTDEDISEIVRGTHNTGSFVRAIEAKLKEKNT
jgi:hypothetical protein